MTRYFWCECGCQFTADIHDDDYDPREIECPGCGVFGVGDNIEDITGDDQSGARALDKKMAAADKFYGKRTIMPDGTIKRILFPSLCLFCQGSDPKCRHCDGSGKPKKDTSDE